MDRVTQKKNLKSEKIAKAAVKKEKGFLYYLDDAGDIYRAKMESSGRPALDPQLVLRLGVKKDKGFLYFIDEEGDVSRSLLA